MVPPHQQHRRGLARAEWGTFKAMPCRAPLAIDAAVGAFSLTAAWLFGVSEAARNTFITMAAIGLTPGLMSRPNEMPAGA